MIIIIIIKGDTLWMWNMLANQSTLLVFCKASWPFLSCKNIVFVFVFVFVFLFVFVFAKPHEHHHSRPCICICICVCISWEEFNNQHANKSILTFILCGQFLSFSSCFHSSEKFQLFCSRYINRDMGKLKDSRSKKGNNGNFAKRSSSQKKGDNSILANAKICKLQTARVEFLLEMVDFLKQIYWKMYWHCHKWRDISISKDGRKYF